MRALTFQKLREGLTAKVVAPRLRFLPSLPANLPRLRTFFVYAGVPGGPDPGKQMTSLLHNMSGLGTSSRPFGVGGLLWPVSRGGRARFNSLGNIGSKTSRMAFFFPLPRYSAIEVTLLYSEATELLLLMSKQAKPSCFQGDAPCVCGALSL